MRLYLAVLFFCSFANNQAKAQVEPGDSLSIDWIKMSLGVNAENDSMNLQGKFILLDFWATHCSSCISSMPKMKEVQDRFSDVLKVLYVHPHSDEEIEDFFGRRPNLRPYRLQMIPITPALKNAFPFSAIPHLIWINPDGIVQAISKGSKDIEQNVESWVQHGRISLPYVPDFVSYSYDHPFFVNFPDLNVSIRKSSTLLGRLESVRLSGGIVQGGNGTGPFRLSIFNTNLVGLYHEIARRLFRFPYSQREIRIRGDAYFDSLKESGEYYSYEYIQPDDSVNDISKLFKAIGEDLDFRLGLRSEIREVDADFFLLYMPADSQSSRDSSYSRHTLERLHFVRQPISTISQVLNTEFKLETPILNEASEGFKASLCLDISNRSLESLQSQLAAQGGRLVPVKRVIKILYIQKDGP